MNKLIFILLTLITFSTFSENFIFVTDIWEPFRIKKDNGLRGIDIEIVTLLENELKIDIKIIQKPWARCLKDMESGTADFMLGLAYTPERAEYIKYLKIPYSQVKPGFFRLKESPEVYKYNDLISKKIGYVTGSFYFEKFDSDSSLNKVGLPRESMLPTMLLRGNIDLFVGTDLQVAYELKEKNLAEKIVITQYSPSYHIDLYLGISKKSSLLKDKEKLELIIKKIVESGEVEKIINRYR